MLLSLIPCVVCVPSFDAGEKSLYGVVQYPKIPDVGEYVMLPGFKNFNYRVVKVCHRPDTTSIVTVEFGNLLGDIFPFLKRQQTKWFEEIPE